MLRRVIGASVSHRNSMWAMAERHGLPYYPLKNFIAGRTNSFTSEEAKEAVRKLGKESAERLGYKAVAEAAAADTSLPERTTYSRRSVQASRAPTVVSPSALASDFDAERLGVLLEKSSGSVLFPERLLGIYDCYRLMPEGVFKSELAIARLPGSRQVEFSEKWIRGDTIVEYWGYVFPTVGFFYFVGANRQSGAPKLLVGRPPRPGGGALIIGSFLAAGRLALAFVASSFVMRRRGPLPEAAKFRPRTALNPTEDCLVEHNSLPAGIRAGLAHFNGDQLLLLPSLETE